MDYGYLLRYCDSIKSWCPNCKYRIECYAVSDDNPNEWDNETIRIFNEFNEPRKDNEK